MPIKTSENPIVRQKIADWSGFVKKYTTKGLSNVHDEASWYTWKKQIKEAYGEDISDKYYFDYRPTFEEFGGYSDTFGEEQEGTHGASHGGTGGGHGSGHVSSPQPSNQNVSQTQLKEGDEAKAIAAAEDILKTTQPTTPTEEERRQYLREHTMLSAEEIEEEVAYEQVNQSQSSPPPTNQATKPSPGVNQQPSQPISKKIETADEIRERLRSPFLSEQEIEEEVAKELQAQSTIVADQSLKEQQREKSSNQPRNPLLLQQLEEEQLAKMQNDDRYKEMAKKVETTLRERFQQRKQQLLTARITEEEESRKWYEERIDKTSPSYEKAVERNNQRYEKNIERYQLPSWRSVSEMRHADGTYDVYEEYTSPLEAWTKNKLEREFWESKGREGMIWKGKGRYVTRDAKGNVLKTYGEADAGPDLRPQSPHAQQIQKAFIESYGEEYGYTRKGEDMVFTGLTITPRTEEIEEESEEQEDTVEEDRSILPSFTPIAIPSIRHTSTDQQPNEEASPSPDISTSHTRDEKQEAASQGAGGTRPQFPNSLKNFLSKGKKGAQKAAKQGLKKGAKKMAKEGAKKAVKEGAKKLAKEGIKKGALALGEYIGGPTLLAIGAAVLIILFLLFLLFLILNGGSQVAQESETGAATVTLTKSVNKSDMKNPSELPEAERDLTYTISYTLSGDASGVITTEPVPTGTVVTSVSGNPTLYDENEQETTEVSKARKVVWSEGVGPNGEPIAGKGAGGGNTGGNGTVVQIGDSLTYGLHLSGIEDTYQTAGWTAIIPGAPNSGGVGECVGRSSGYPCHGVSGGSSPTGLEAVDLNQNEIRGADAVVVQMGTNETEGSMSTFQSAMGQMIDKIRAINASAKIYWVNIASPINIESYSARNQAIYTVATAKNVTVIDWFRAVYPSGDPKNIQPGLIAKNGWLPSNDVHPSSAGYQALSELIVSSIGGNTKTNTTNTATSAEGTIHNLGFGPSDATRIENMIKKLSPRSPMVNQGQTIIDRAREFNLDPLMIIVNRNESQFCADNGVVSPGGSDPDNYNCGGIIWDAAQWALKIDESKLEDITNNRWRLKPGPSANGHVFTFAPTIQDGIGLFFNYITASGLYNGKTLQAFYEKYNPCSDPGNGGKFACGADEANNMLEVLKESAGPASDGSAITTTSGSRAPKSQSYTITLRVNADVKDTYIINQATSIPIGGTGTTTTTTDPNTPIVATKPAGWPTSGRITQGPQGRYDHGRIYAETGGYEGLDVANVEGTPLYATFDGKVKQVYDCKKEGDCARGYWGTGNSVILSDEKDTFNILYGHLSRIDVAEGSQVRRGMQIGTMGNTGVSTGSHLHWEFRTIKMEPPYIPQAITPPDCDPSCTPSSIEYTKIESQAAPSSYWMILHRKSEKEQLYQGPPGDTESSALVKEYRVNTGTSGKSPTPLPRLAGRDYWVITKKQTNSLDADKAALGPFFLILDIPFTNKFNGPLNYTECSYTGPNQQCEWPTPGAFGLHGIGDTPSRMIDDGSSGCVRHTNEEITELYKLLSPVNDEIRYYVFDD